MNHQTNGADGKKTMKEIGQIKDASERQAALAELIKSGGLN